MTSFVQFVGTVALDLREMDHDDGGMRDNRLGGLALIVGAVSGIITMTLHPVGGRHAITSAAFEKLAAMLVGVHVLAIAGIPFLFFGAIALTRRLDSPNRLALLALVTFGMSMVAVLIAPALSGLVGTNILRRIAAGGSDSAQWRLLLDYNHMINQAFSRIYAVASISALGLWSLAIVRSRALSPAVGYYGLVLALATLVAIAFGLRMDVHGFGMIIFGEGIWLIIVGVLLMRTDDVRPAAAQL